MLYEMWAILEEGNCIDYFITTIDSSGDGNRVAPKCTQRMLSICRLS